MKNVLITGFEPFGGEPVNPALQAIKALDGRIIEGHLLVTRQLPVNRFDSIATITQYIQATQPVLVIAVGQAGGRSEISLERVAINCDDFRIPDNAGKQPIDEAVVLDGPVAYWSSLPIKAIVATLCAAGIPAAVSNTAGTFVCNHLFYGLMHHLATLNKPLNSQLGQSQRISGGFIHIPYLPEQAARLSAQMGAQPSMALSTIVQGLELAVSTALTVKTDSKQVGGTIC